MSIIWGVGLAALFRRVCKGKNCIVYKAPNPEWMKTQIVESGGLCFQMMPETSACYTKKKNHPYH